MLFRSLKKREADHQGGGDVVDEVQEEARGADKDQRAEYPECPRPITSCPQWNTPWTDLSTPSENIAPSSMNRYEDHSGRKVGPITNKGHSHYSQSKASFKEQPTLTKPK